MLFDFLFQQYTDFFCQFVKYWIAELAPLIAVINVCSVNFTYIFLRSKCLIEEEGEAFLLDHHTHSHSSGSKTFTEHSFTFDVNTLTWVKNPLRVRGQTCSPVSSLSSKCLLSSKVCRCSSQWCMMFLLGGCTQGVTLPSAPFPSSLHFTTLTHSLGVSCGSAPVLGLCPQTS